MYRSFYIPSTHLVCYIHVNSVCGSLVSSITKNFEIFFIYTWRLEKREVVSRINSAPRVFLRSFLASFLSSFPPCLYSNTTYLLSVLFPASVRSFIPSSSALMVSYYSTSVLLCVQYIYSAVCCFVVICGDDAAAQAVYINIYLEV